MKRLVLVGAGHTHALVLRALVRQPLVGIEVVILSPEPLAPYSGMVPGWLAGLYRFDEIVVDFPPLAQAAGAFWRQGELQALDAARRRIVLTDGSTLDYDVLSLNVGSTLRPPRAEHAEMLPLRPLSLLRERYDPLLARWLVDGPDRPSFLTAVGGGAAGFESLLGVLRRLRRLRPERRVHARLISRGMALLPELSAAARRGARRALDRAGVSVELGSGWCDSVDQGSDIVLWATGAEAHDWQRDSARRGALSVDADGFIRIDAQLRSISHPHVFAAGDCASWLGRDLPKAGVYAVRMGPVLTSNLRIALTGSGRLTRYRPQRRSLVLLGTGDGRAIASRGHFGAEGAWIWRWKDRIDRRFLIPFRALGSAKRCPDPVSTAGRASAVSPGEPP